MSGEVATKLAELKARGIATGIPGLEALLRQNTSVAKEIYFVVMSGAAGKAARFIKENQGGYDHKAKSSTQGNQFEPWSNN